MLKLLPLLLLFLQQTEVPFKPNEEFILQVEYKFKTKPAAEHYTLDFSESREQSDRKVGQLPYLIVHITALKLPEGEERVKIITHGLKVIESMKVKQNVPFGIDLGFTDDMKDGVTPNAYNVVFYNKQKKQTTRIYLTVNEDGIFLVNGEQRGKF